MSNWQIGDWVLLRPEWLLPTLLLLLAAMVWRGDTRRSHWREVLSPAIFDYLGGNKRQSRRWNLPLLLAALTTSSLSQPALRQSDDATWRQSIGWIALADVSRSMTLNDTVPSRLGAMREALAELSRQAAARPLALILFSGDAFLVCPPSFDRTVFNEHAAQLEYGVIPLDGSNLARALSLATEVIADSQLRGARVFVLGDSGGVGDGSMAAARFLKDAGHRVDMLVFGSSGQGSSRTPDNTVTGLGSESWSQGLDESDETAVNWQEVQRLARVGGGLGIRASSFGVIDYQPLKLDRQSSASTHAELQSLVLKDQSHWLLLGAVPLLLLAFHRESGN